MEENRRLETQLSMKNEGTVVPNRSLLSSLAGPTVEHLRPILMWWLWWQRRRRRLQTSSKSVVTLIPCCFLPPAPFRTLLPTSPCCSALLWWWKSVRTERSRLTSGRRQWEKKTTFVVRLLSVFCIFIWSEKQTSRQHLHFTRRHFAFDKLGGDWQHMTSSIWTLPLLMSNLSVQTKLNCHQDFNCYNCRTNKNPSSQRATGEKEKHRELPLTTIKGKFISLLWKK